MAQRTLGISPRQRCLRLRGRIAIAFAFTGSLRILWHKVHLIFALSSSETAVRDHTDTTIATTCIGLDHFPAHTINISQAAKGMKSKAEYFEAYLGSQLNISHGRQTDKEKDLCLKASNTDILPAKDLTDAGYNFVIFVGDSLAREAAWSMRRLADSDPSQCQPWPLRYNGDTKGNDVNFMCEDRSNGLSCRGKAKTIANHIPESCCEKPFVLFRWKAMLRNMEGFMTDINRKCNCKGAIYMQAALHFLEVDDKYKKIFGGIDGRGEWTYGLLSSLTSNNPQNHSFVWATPPAIDTVTMRLPPQNPNLERWEGGARETLHHWKEQDEEALTRLNHPSVYKSEWFDVSAAYTGLSCDGYHFGLSYDHALFGCGGMHVVTDVANQLWLHRLLLPDRAFPSIC